MNALKVLAIDTSTECCSAALSWTDGQLLLRGVVTERGHADLILPMIDELLAEAGCRLTDLDGLAFGRGPGGFTGLRIAAGVIQGLAFGAGLPVAPVSSLAAVAFLTSPTAVGEVARSAGEGVLVCNDARMNEVYWGCYRFDAHDPCAPVLLAPEAVSPADRVDPAVGVSLFAGNGIARFQALQARLEAAGLAFRSGIYPRADAIARLGERVLRMGDGVAAAAALPVYIRDDVARPARPAVT
jgi:tRNA threonylcarbamoyladenosine biosynthesis protein TsaB